MFSSLQNNSLREDFLVKTDDEVRRVVTDAIQKIAKDPIQGKVESHCLNAFHCGKCEQCDQIICSIVGRLLKYELQ